MRAADGCLAPADHKMLQGVDGCVQLGWYEGIA